MGNPSNVTFSVPFACYDGRYRTAYPQGDYPLPAPAGLSAPSVSSTTITAQLASLPAWVENVEWGIRRASDSAWTVAGDQRTTTFTFTELDPDTAYQLRARLQYLAFYSGYSPVAAATTEPDAPGLPVPPPLSGPTRIDATTLSIGITGGSGADSWTAQYRTPAGSGSYQTEGPVSLTSTAHNFAVIEGAEYDFRIVATNTHGSVNSNVVTGSTATATPFFTDDFERTNLLPYMQNGAAWTGEVYVSTQTTEPLIGTRSARFRYNATAQGSGTWSELPMNKREGGVGIGRQLTEFSLRYLMLLPLNFVHRLEGEPDNNNKGIVQLWSGPYGAGPSNQFIGFEYWPDIAVGGGDGGSALSFRWGIDGKEKHFYGTNPEDPADMWSPTATWPGTGPGSMFQLSDRGKRIQWRVHVKLASGPGAVDGVIRVWKYVEGSSPQMILELTKWPYSTRGNFIDQLYVLGYANSGFAQQTDIYVDDFNLAEGGLIGWGNFS